ncbi:MAG: hypothetical protein ACJ74Z_10520 [Bryobacteraceae bacterium]
MSKSTSTGVPNPQKPAPPSGPPEESHDPASPPEPPDKPRDPVRSSEAPELTDLKKRILDEYKLLQDKMDKIGGFRFTIKGWSITAIAGASVASFATTGAGKAPMMLVSTVLGLMVVFFFAFEVEQVRLSRLFGRRARALEKTLRDIDRGKVPLLPRIPNTAHEIAKASYQRTLANSRRSVFDKIRSRIREDWKVGESADRWFYVVLLCIAFAPTFPYVSQLWRVVLNTAVQASHVVAALVHGVLNRFR